MMYSNIIVINNYDILHIISIIMRLCMIKHPGTHASTVSTRTTTTNGYQPNKKNGYHGIVTEQFIEGDYNNVSDMTFGVILFQSKYYT